MSIMSFSKCLLLLVLTSGGLIIMRTNVNAAPSFKLRPPQYYFSGNKTLELVAAAMAGDMLKAKWLVSEGANPNDEGPANNKYNRLRPLHYAIASNNKPAVEILVSVGADPELSVQGFGRSFLFAMTLDNHEMLSFLLDLRPISTLSKDTIEYVLSDSVAKGCLRCLTLLLDRGAPVDFRNGAGYTVMMDAMDAQDYDLAEWLLQRGASVGIETPSGMTPAYSVEFHLNKFKPGSPTYNKVLHLKKMMEERGAVFPALSPAEVRARREQKNN